MADLTPKTIAELPSAGTHTGTELTVLMQGSAAKKSTIADLVYPVGAIYMSVNSTSPATLFGGTWVQIKDTFLLSAGDVYTAGATGGEATHTLTENEMPKHKHDPAAIEVDGELVDMAVSWPVSPYVVDSSGVYSFSGTGMRADSATDYWTGETGGGAAHNNMPPYLAVYMWRRTA